MAIRLDKASLLLLVTVVTACVLLSGCHPVPSLAYSHDPNVLVIEADSQTYPGAPPPTFARCNLIPPLRVWGDGRVVAVPDRPYPREVLTGRIGADEIDHLLGRVAADGFFTPDYPLQNPDETSWSLRLRLQAGDFHQTWFAPSQAFQDAVQAIPATELSVVVPQQGWLRAVRVGTSSNSPNDHTAAWPPRFGSVLRDAASKDQRIEGDALAFVWSVLNANVYSPIIRDGDDDFQVVLIVPGVTLYSDNAGRTQCVDQSIPAELTAVPATVPSSSTVQFSR